MSRPEPSAEVGSFGGSPRSHRQNENPQQQQQQQQHQMYFDAQIDLPLTPTMGNTALESFAMDYGEVEASPEVSMSPRTSAVSAVSAAAAARVNQACASCRRKKVRCDGVQPACGNCTSRGMGCTYLAQKKRGRPPKVTIQQSTMPYFTPSSATQSQLKDPYLSPGVVFSGSQQQQQHSMHAYFGQWQSGLPAVNLSAGSSAPQAGSAVNVTLAPLNSGISQATPTADHSHSLSSPTAALPLQGMRPVGMYSYSQQPLQSAGTSSFLDLGVIDNTQRALFSGYVRSAATETHGNDYFGTFPVSTREPVSNVLLHDPMQQQQPPPQRTSMDDARMHAMSFSMTPTMAAAPLLSVPNNYGTSGVLGLSQPDMTTTPGVETDYQGVRQGLSPRPPNLLSAGAPADGLFFTEFVQHFMPLTVPPPVPPLLQQYQSQNQQIPSNVQNDSQDDVSQGANHRQRQAQFQSQFQQGSNQPQRQGQSQSAAAPPATSGGNSGRLPLATEKDALSFTLGNVAIAMTKHDSDSASVQSSLDHLSYVTKSISYASQEALEHAREAAAEAVASIDSNQGDISADSNSNRNGINGSNGSNSISDGTLNGSFIHETLLRIERCVELADKAVHNYFSYIHPQCPIIHKPTFLRQISDGSINHFVWFALRALAARTLLHTHVLSESEVLIEEEYFASKAHMTLSSALNRPSAEVVQGLALLSLYIFGTPRWQEASMYWCKATRLAQLMEYHVIDAPSRTIATKMHFGIFEPTKCGTTHRDDLALIPGDFSGQHMPLAQALSPLEAELRRRLWWTLFTNERFCSIAERLPTMVNEARMFVHFPCSARDWDQPEFTYQAPARVPRYLREGYTRAELGDDLNKLSLGQEMVARKADNLYLMCEIEYGFSMSHLVAFLADMGSLFRPRSPYGNDYIPMFMQISWPHKMKTLQANVERVERIFEMVRQNILQRLAAAPPQNPAAAAATNDTTNTANGRRAPSSPLHTTKAGINSESAASPQKLKHSTDPVLDREAYVPGIEIPHLHQLNMLVLYSVLNIHLYRMVFQIHYEFSSSLSEPDKRRQEDNQLLAAFDQYVKELWLRTTTAAQQVSRILRGEFPGVPHWVLTLAGIKRVADCSQQQQQAHSGIGSLSTTGPNPLIREHRPLADSNTLPERSSSLSSPSNMMDVDGGADSDPARGEESGGKNSGGGNGNGAERPTQQQQAARRLRNVFQERIKAQEAKFHGVTLSVFSSFRRTLPYALIMAAKVHVDNIEWWTDERQDDNMARAYLDLADIVRFLETHQTAFSSTDYVSLVKGMMRVVDS
ncbi:fungal-specific transcription factor domain-containing protein [Kickxella alabastrina]|uniref:fungal-specific transcription factor domain-containing protein n=1 Tax=Kickxella alabastrina TaxID=61397 RepID=UPI00221F944B|nr:fungal-specific transcription factor domain-containing protein [Kickxella alabastrina]KAI7834267.1 fungal-specific transcription factor domain-containing protein [Kickxella alabastrina]